MTRGLQGRGMWIDGWCWWNALRGCARLFRPHPALACHLPHPGEGFFGGAMLYVVPLSNGDPACWRPAREAGFDCAAMIGGRVRPCTRCAASLRMTRGGQGRGNKFVWRKI